MGTEFDTMHGDEYKKSTSIDRIVNERLRDFRTKLLDLTGRNPLLNFRLSSDRAKTHIRVIDELPDFLFGAFIEGRKLNFKPLPRKTDEPHDEENEKFQSIYRQAKITDEAYIQEIESITDKEDTFEEITQIERRLKDRVRVQLGMAPIKDLKPLSNAEWAKRHNIEPNYDLPRLTVEDKEFGNKSFKHSDDWMQTIHFPKELEQKLQGLKRYISSDINETGVNTFYVAFGFLQWYDRESTDKPFYAPLMLLQLDPMVERKNKNGELFFTIEASGEEPQYNLPLAERLKDFGLSLPELDENDTPESYILKVELLVKNKPKWKVRRFVTIGRFQFARLVMYHDLNPDKWPVGAAITDNPIIKGLLSGHITESNGPNTNDLSTYDIDVDPEVEQAAPILITEADSSQHSAIVDVLKGHNLVIKGPPGTGKSQTITNLIANSLAQGKRVLFIAEKMAALDVVYSRLKQAGLGDFCLELHSTKSKLKDVRDTLATCLSNRKSSSQPRALPEKIQELKKAKLHLRQYSDILNQPFGSTGKTIHDILWSEQARRHIVGSQPAFIKGLRINQSESFSLSEIASYCEELRKFEELSSENAVYIPSNHPWKGVGLSQISGLKISEIIQAAEESLDAINATLKTVDAFEQAYGWNLGETLNSFNQFRDSWLEISEYKSSHAEMNFNLLPHLAILETIPKIENFISKLEDYNIQVKLSRETILNPEKILPRLDIIAALCKQAQALGLSNLTAQQIRNYVEKLQLTHAEWQELEPKLSFVSWKILGKDNPSIREISLMTEGIRLCSNISRGALLLRTEDALSDTSAPVISSALEKQKTILALENRLKVVLNLKASISDVELDIAIYELTNANILSYFKSDFYKACKTYKSLRISKSKIDYNISAQELRDFKQYRADLASFNTDIRYSTIAGKFFEGISTEFTLIYDLNSWAKNVRQSFFGLDVVEEKIKGFLLTGSISDIDAVLSHLPVATLEKVNESIRFPASKDITCRDHISNQSGIVKNGSDLAKVLEQLRASDSITFSDIDTVLSISFMKMAEISANIEAQQDIYYRMIGPSFSGTKTNLAPLKNTIILARKIQAVSLPNQIKRELHNDKIFDIADKVCKDLAPISIEMQQARKRIDTFCILAAIDFELYTGVKETVAISMKALKSVLQKSLSDNISLTILVKCNDFMNQASSRPYHELLKLQEEYGIVHDGVVDTFEYLIYRTLCDFALQKNNTLDDQNLLSLDQIRTKYQKLDREIINLQCQELAYQLNKVPLPEGISKGYVSDYTEMGLIRHQVQGKARQIPLRRFIEKSGAALQTLKPCFLMSPLSVAQYISPKGIKFDLVVIDEASQMCPEDALGAIARCGQIVVVGDPQQLPPTAFFQKQLSESSDDYEEEDKLDNESILDLAHSRYFPPRELLWHYRSRHESLIAFSNAQFYDGRLIVFPSPENRSDRFGVSSRYVGGIYSTSCNDDEAKAVVDAARQFMRDHLDMSLGIATMNSQQRDLIDEKMQQLFLHDEYAGAYKQKWSGTLEPFFVKNLESVQGDERDSIFVSTVYGPSAKDAKPAQRFGPINGKFGHRRLNVLFTRAKYNLVLFTSLRPDQIVANENSSQGLKAFKAYLEYAATGKIDVGVNTGRSIDSDFEAWVKARLESKGYEVTPQIGVAGYFIDLGVKHPNYPYGYLLGIECDGAMYHSSKSARDRDRIRQQVLEGLGWSIYRIWSTSWFHSTDREFEKLVNYIEQTLRIKLSEHQNREEANKVFVSKFHDEIQLTLFEESSNTPNDEDSKLNVMENDQSSVQLYDTVSYRFIDEKKEKIRTVTIVASQSDVSSGNINQYSAMGRVLIGGKMGDELEVNLPNGSRTILIMEVKKYKTQ